ELAKSSEIPKGLLKTAEGFSNRNDLEPSTKEAVISLIWNWIIRAVQEICTSSTSDEKQQFVAEELERLSKLNEAQARELILRLVESGSINPDTHRQIDLFVGKRLGLWINKPDSHLDQSAQQAIL